MPQTYEVELSDGRIVEVESGEEPTHEQLMSALGTWEEPQAAPAQQQLEPPSWLGAPTQSASTPSIAQPFNFMPPDAVRAAWDESGIPVIPPPIPGSQRYSPTGDILGQPNSEGLTAIANDPRGFVRSIPQIAMGALTAPGKLAYQTAADVVSTVAGQPEYGGNLAAGMQGMDAPVEKFLSDVSKTNPKLAVAGKVGKSLTEMAPLGAVGMLPKALGVLASAGFTADMIAKAPALFKDYAEEINKPKEQQDPDKLTTLQSDILQTFTFAPLAGAHAVRGGIDAVSQRLNTERQAALPDTQLQPGVPREGISETVKPPTQGVQNEAQSQVQLQAQQPEASRPSQVQERAGEIVQEQPESRAEVAPEPESVSPIVSEFISEYSKPSDQFKISNSSNDPNQITTAKVGESVKTIADLDALLKLNNDLREWVADFNQKKKEGRKAPKEELDKFYSLGFGGIQFPREVVERAVNAGSGAKENKNQFEAAFENRPLDWRNNPEVADWLKKNAAALKITLPDELTASANAQPSEAVAGETLAPAPSPEPASAENAPTQPKPVADWTSATEETPPAPARPPEQVKAGLKIKLGNRKEGGFVRADIINDIVDYGKSFYRKGMKLAEWVSHAVKEFGESVRQFAVEAWGKIKTAYENSEWSDETGAISLGGRGAMPQFKNRKMSPLDRVTTSHSGKLQKSFSESRTAQKDIQKIVPSEKKRNAISIYREAAGDMAVLKDWETRAKQKWMRDAARDAQSLTAKEASLLPKVESAYSTMETRGNTYDVLGSHRDNYVTHVWDVKQPGTGFGTGMLKNRFRFSKARTFNTFFEGDQAGFKPKTLDIAKLLPAYIHEMNRVIADRQAVRDLAKGTMPDGSPMAVPKGNVKVVDGPKGKAVLVSPKAMKVADTSDYKVMENQPALSNWIWEGKDTDGKPVFVNADLAVHPSVYRRLTAMLGQSELRKWYRDPVTGTAQIPRAIVRGLDTAQSAMKREMFGLLAPFHQVQEGTHAVGHLVNPFFGLEKVDLVNNPKMADAANHGLMLLPDRASAQVYMEGVGTKSSLLSQGLRKTGKFTAGIGEAISDVVDGYQDYLFHQYIPSLKYKTYEAMVGRNTKLYAKELASGEMTPADVKLTSAEQANAAYGHLNYALLDRNPTIQHFIQLAALAPDFLEARARFVGQGVKGLRSKVGHEQLKAIAILAAAQAGTAAVLSQLLGVNYDPEHPFEVIYGGRRYSMRSVPEDIFGLIKDTRQFVYSRVNPLTVKGSVQLATGLNYRGEKVSATETMAELLAGYLPITARSIPALRNLTETGRHTPVTPLQQLAGSLGLRISRYSPVSETYRLAGEWMEKQKLPKDRGSYPVSKYQQLRYALEDGDLERAKAEYEALKKDTPARKVRDGFKQSLNHPFTGSQADDKKFAKTLTGYDKELYDEAIRTRKNILKAFNSF